MTPIHLFIGLLVVCLILQFIVIFGLGKRKSILKELQRSDDLLDDLLKEMNKLSPKVEITLREGITEHIASNYPVEVKIVDLEKHETEEDAEQKFSGTSVCKQDVIKEMEW